MESSWLTVTLDVFKYGMNTMVIIHGSRLTVTLDVFKSRDGKG